MVTRSTLRHRISLQYCIFKRTRTAYVTELKQPIYFENWCCTDSFLSKSQW